jgi:hypothetical protein
MLKQIVSGLIVAAVLGMNASASAQASPSETESLMNFARVYNGEMARSGLPITADATTVSYGRAVCSMLDNGGSLEMLHENDTEMLQKYDPSYHNAMLRSLAVAEIAAIQSFCPHHRAMED